MDNLVRKIELPLAKRVIEKAGLYIVPENRIKELSSVAADAYRDYPLHNWFSGGKYDEYVSAKIMEISLKTMADDAVMYADKFMLHSLPGGGVEDGEDVQIALRREVYEETGCVCDEIQELGIVAENRASLDYTQINYYFVVTTSHTPGENHLTEAEQDSRTVVEWHTFDEMVRLINAQEFDRVQGKYLKARDVAALREYAKQIKE